MHNLFSAHCKFASDLCIRLTAVSLVLSFSTVILAVTAENPGNAAARIPALKLARQAHMDVCIEEK